MHSINRDGSEKYQVIIENKKISVYDHQGNKKTVNTPDDSLTYLTTTNPEQDIQAVTVADYTFIVNKTRKVANTMGSSSNLRKPEGIIYVRTGDYGTSYKVWVDGFIMASYTTPNDNRPAINTDAIAKQLKDKIDAGGQLPSHLNVTQVGSNLYIKSSSAEKDFTLTVDDGAGGKALIGIKGSVEDIADLPPSAYKDFTVEVAPTGDDGYYLRYNEGSWVETRKPERVIGLIDGSMPHRLVSNANGTFTFERIEWAKRNAGDEETNPYPSFLNRTIQSLFFYRNRLGFLTDENVVLSEDGEYYNFFRKTLMTLLDTEVIDIGSTSNQISILKHAVPYQDYLIIFSDTEQFMLAHGDTLSPTSAYISSLTQYVSASPSVPIVTGDNILFPSSNQYASKVMEYFIDPDAKAGQANEASGHCPSYIKGTVRKMVNIGNTNTVAILADSDPTELYVYSFLYQGGAKEQASFSKFTFSGTIRSISNVDSDLLLLIDRCDRTYLEYLRLEDDGVLKSLGFPSSVHLDGLKVWEKGDTVSTVSGSMGMSIKGRYDTVSSFLDVDGKATELIATGIPYSFLYQLSEIVVRGQEGSVGNLYDRLQLRRITVRYDNTGYFKVIVKNKGRDDRTTTFTGNSVGSLDNILGKRAVYDGSLSVSLQSETRNTVIQLHNDSPFPSTFQQAEWEALYSPRR